MASYKDELDAAREEIRKGTTVNESIKVWAQAILNRLASLEAALREAGNDEQADAVAADIQAFKASREEVATLVAENTGAA